MLCLHFRLRSKTAILQALHQVPSEYRKLFICIHSSTWLCVFCICLMVVISYAIARTNPIRSSLASMESHNLQGLWFICVWKEHTNIKSKLYYLSILRSLSPGFVGRMGSKSRRQMTSFVSFAVCFWSCWGGCSPWLGCCGVSAGQQKQMMFWLLPVPARCSSLCWYRCSFVLNSRCWELAYLFFWCPCHGGGASLKEGELATRTTAVSDCYC